MSAGIACGHAYERGRAVDASARFLTHVRKLASVRKFYKRADNFPCVLVVKKS
jgi:hypothetical protein